MSETLTVMPPLGTKATCAACGKVVWFKRVGTMGHLGDHPGAPVYQWCARKGTKPRPIACPVTNGWPSAYHRPEGFETIYYGEPE